MVLEVSQLGIIVKMSKSSGLSLILEFILTFFWDKPIDWQLGHILWAKVCNPKKDEKHWDPHKANLRICFKLSLFQDVGPHSSLAGGQDPKLKNKDLGKLALQKQHMNVPMEESASLQTRQHYPPEQAFLRGDFL